MHILLFGATGAIGQRIAKEALARGHTVTGVVRDPAQVRSPDARISLVQGDATDAMAVARLARGMDAVVSAISPRPNPRGRQAVSLAAASRALLDGVRKAGVQRLLVVGGAGTLEVSPGVRLMDTPGFPAAYQREAQEGADSLAALRRDGAGIAWTFVSPAAEIGPGPRTGRYRTTDDRFLADASGRSHISYDDYAVALVDELEQPQHRGARFGVAY